jgi:mxaJ protein
MHGQLTRRGLVALALVMAAGFVLPAAAQQSGLGEAIELVDPKTLRVCADPNNLPFSNEKGEGFENRLAELIEQKLGN